jgi:hypothetical protein
MSGESGLTMKVVFRRDRWMHTCSASKLIEDNKKLRREKFVSEELNAVVFYADMVDKKCELQNLLTIKQLNIPCWPNVDVLLSMFDRHTVLRKCKELGLITHPIYQETFYNRHRCSLEYPFVLKSGNTHRGENKFLIESEAIWQSKHQWDGIATMEPFFDGRSIRALVVGDKTFGIEITNNTSWIKNSSGAEISVCELSQDLIAHANTCAKLFGLDIAGVDYIISKDGNFNLLEINQFPGLAFVSEEATGYIEKFLDDKLAQLELCI